MRFPATRWRLVYRIFKSTKMNDEKDNKTHNVENLERMHGITDDMETEDDSIDMATKERCIFFQSFSIDPFTRRIISPDSLDSYSGQRQCHLLKTLRTIKYWGKSIRFGI